MQAEHYDEWQTLEATASNRLRQGFTPDDIGVSQLFQVMELPSFEPVINWDIYQRSHKDEFISYFAIYACWRQDKDLEKFNGPLERLRHPRHLTPTLEIKTVELDNTFVEAALNKLRSISIPPFCESTSFGCDGTSYEFSFDAGCLVARYQWWETPPNLWRPLGDFVDEGLTYLSKLKGASE